MDPICQICEGVGLTVMRREDGVQFAEPCICRLERRTQRLIARAQIPRRFQECSFESYGTTHPSSNKSLERALSQARHFVETYPLETDGKGLLFVGSKGLGKTHLAISLLKGVISDRAASGIFWEHKELMENLRIAMFGNGATGAEGALLKSLITCDVLILDDLGDITPSDWTWDTTCYILNSRYNERRSTIITTNLANQPSMAPSGDPHDRFSEARRAVAGETLGDRIGDRMWSRLQEMCVVVEMHGEDFRQKVKRASFA